MKKEMIEAMRARGIPTNSKELEDHFRQVGEQTSRTIAGFERQKEALENNPEEEIKKLLLYRVCKLWSESEACVTDDMRLLLEIESGKFKRIG